LDIDELRNENFWNGDFGTEVETDQQRVFFGKHCTATAANFLADIQDCVVHPAFIGYDVAVFDELYAAVLVEGDSVWRKPVAQVVIVAVATGNHHLG